ncbi:MAG: hypothetical protein HQL23_07675 [Candidatus Omnitrophica bacterium]|nr:hypothetical protein [Candidatus Omnitrophota bacterium]
MKKLMLLIAAVFFTCLLSQAAQAKDWTVPAVTLNAHVPAATQVVAVVKKIVDNVETTPIDVTNGVLDFNKAGALSFDTKNGIYTSNVYYQIYLSPVQADGITPGAGVTIQSVTITYDAANEIKPTGQIKGLGDHAILTVERQQGGVDPTTKQPYKPTADLTYNMKRLKAYAGTVVTLEPADLTLGKFFRFDVGICTKKDAQGNDQDCDVFTNNDASGDYSGQLTLTATSQ